MYLIRLKRRGGSPHIRRKPLDCYDIVIRPKKRRNSLNLGVFHYKIGIVVLDVKMLVYTMSKGLTFKESVRRMLIRTTANLTGNKNIEVKYAC